MRASIPPLLYWAPRVLGVLFALFLGVFALDVIQPGEPIGEVAVALVIHLIPSIVLLLVLAVAWRHEFLGSLGFVGLAILYVILSRGRVHWSAHALISGPALLIGALFCVNGWARRSPPGGISSAGSAR